MRTFIASSGATSYELRVRPVPHASHLFTVEVRRPDGTEESHKIQVLSRTSERWTVVLEDDRILDVVVSPLADSVLVNCNGRTYRVRISKKGPAGQPAGDEQSSGTVRADMAGKVVAILKRPGDGVEAGDALAILEAMKMQNPIKAPRKGRIKESNLSEGQLVAAGQVLFELEPES